MKLKNTSPSLDLLDDVSVIQNRKISHLIRKIEMIYGEIWEYAIGTYGNNQLIRGTDFKSYGLDVINPVKKQVFEINNRTNTLNSGSKKEKIDKFRSFKNDYPEYQCILGLINDETVDKTLKGQTYIEEKDIYVYIGKALFNEIFGSNTVLIVGTIKDRIKIHVTTILLKMDHPQAGHKLS